MTTQRSPLRPPRRILVPALLAAFVALAAAAPRSAHAQIDPGMLVSSPAGVTDGQYVRVGAYFVTTDDGPAGYPPGPCRVTLSFLDQAGTVLTQSAVLLAPGRAAQLDYRPTLRTGQRAQVRAVLVGERDANGYTPHLVPSLEVVDVATGRTTVSSPGTIVGFNPQPDPPGDIAGFNPQPDPPGDVGLFGVASAQTARLSATYVGVPSDSGFPPDPCDVTLTFFNGDGQVLASRRATVAPGATIFLDVPAGYLPPGFRQRMYAKVSTASAPQGFVTPSLEVFDSASGRSTMLMPSAFVRLPAD